jgi:hypothetical protein
MHWAADENFNNDIIRGLLRRKPDVDIVRVQDIGLSGADDPTVLEWAADEGRVLLTQMFRPSRSMPTSGSKLASRCLASLKSVVMSRWV